MLNEYMKFTKKKPLTGAVIGISIIYGANMVRKAFTAEAGGFWGIGASTSTTSSTSSSHSMMNREPAGDMMKHPTSLFGYRDLGSHCTGGVGHACTNPHCHCGGAGLGAGHKGRMKTMYGHKGSDYGEDVYKSPLTLMGVPSHIKRRVGNAEDTESYRPTNPVVPEVETVESALGWI